MKNKTEADLIADFENMDQLLRSADLTDQVSHYYSLELNHSKNKLMGLGIRGSWYKRAQ